jgi:diacylglycerol O-acyltransferase-1
MFIRRVLNILISLCCDSDYPMLGIGCSKTVAVTLVFLFSAVMHEVIISIPFRHFALHAFLGMLVQAPLISVTKYVDNLFNNPFIGNAIFWCAFCVLGSF